MILPIVGLASALCVLFLSMPSSGYNPPGALYAFDVVLLGSSLWYFLRGIRNVFKLREAGWVFSKREVFWNPDVTGLKLDGLLMKKEEFQSTPLYDSSLSELENLRLCLNAMKEAKTGKTKKSNFG